MNEITVVLLFGLIDDSSGRYRLEWDGDARSPNTRSPVGGMFREAQPPLRLRLTDPMPTPVEDPPRTAVKTEADQTKRDRWINEYEAAEFIGVRAATLRTWPCHGRNRDLPYAKVGRLIRYKRGDVEDWMNRHKISIER